MVVQLNTVSKRKCEVKRSKIQKNLSYVRSMPSSSVAEGGIYFLLGTAWYE